MDEGNLTLVSAELQGEVYNVFINPHCHLIFNRVDNNGRRISDSNWLKRNVRICKELKQKYGLTNDVKSTLKESRS